MTDTLQAATDHEKIREELNRVLASADFSASAQLSRFLRYAVESYIAGETDRLKESAIGVAVFNRAPGYDPKTDPIVRVEARRLRAKLETYYSGPGMLDEMRISLPKGAYCPSFEILESPVPEPIVAELPAPPAARNKPWRWVIGTGIAVSGVLLLLARPEPAVHIFWKSLLQGDKPALLVPADSGLVMMQDLTDQSVRLQDYITGEYRGRSAKAGTAAGFGNRRYTSIADLDFAVGLAGRPEATGHTPRTRYARDVRVDDLKNVSVILLGAKHSNPWVELFEKEATFRLDHDEAGKQFRIFNTAPQAGERQIYNDLPPDLNHVYGIITFHRNREASGYALLVAGTSVAGTESAADFVLADHKIGPYLERARQGSTIRGFDLLLESSNLAGSSPKSSVVAFHISER